MKLLFRTSERLGFSSATYLLWQTPDCSLVESSILYLHGRSIPWVFCFPTSVGCSLGCRICAMPKTTSPDPLQKEDLLEMFQYSLRYSHATQFQVSFMGQGEPLLNTQNVFGFCAQLYRDFPEATIGISTVGISTGIRALSTQNWVKRVKLQISLHVLPQTKRSDIIPAESMYPIKEAILEAKRMCDTSGTRCALNCVLLDGINDSVADAHRVAEAAAGGPFYVKVSEFNPHRNCPLRPATSAQIEVYCEVLRVNKVEVHRFASIGTNIGAGCGQTRLAYSNLQDNLFSKIRDTVNV